MNWNQVAFRPQPPHQYNKVQECAFVVNFVEVCAFLRSQACIFQDVAGEIGTNVGEGKELNASRGMTR